MQDLSTYFKQDIKLYGPKSYPVEKIRFHWRFHCLIKYNASIEQPFKKALLHLPKAHKDIRVFLDIDPRNIL